jgi:hypothetical protein
MLDVADGLFQQLTLIQAPEPRIGGENAGPQTTTTVSFVRATTGAIATRSGQPCEQVSGRDPQTSEIAGKVHALFGVRVGGLSNNIQEALMRRFLVTAGTVLALGGVSATGALAADPHNQNGSPSTGQPSQSCQNTTPPAFPGNTANAPGSAFNGTAGNVYANPDSQGGLSSGNSHVVAQYDVACFQQTQH